MADKNLADASAAEVKAEIIKETAQETKPTEQASPKETVSKEEPLQEPSLERAPTEEQPSEEKLYAGKFKTPEELEKSYLEAERKITQTAQEAANARKVAEELYGSFEASSPQPAAAEAPLSEFEESPASTKEETERAQQMVRGWIGDEVGRRVGPLIAELEVEKAMAKYSDFNELKPLIKTVYDEFPELRRPGNLERAIRLAKAEKLPEVEKAAKEEGAAEMKTKIQEGEAAKTESAKTSSSRGDKFSLSDEAVSRMGAKELKELLPH